MWVNLTYFCWAICVVLGGWMLFDWYKIDTTYSEETLTSSREGEIEVASEKTQDLRVKS
jgi:hypothetical protein